MADLWTRLVCLLAGHDRVDVPIGADLRAALADLPGRVEVESWRCRRCAGRRFRARAYD
jgi:hypothetical protein